MEWDGIHLISEWNDSLINWTVLSAILRIIMLLVKNKSIAIQSNAIQLLRHEENRRKIFSLKQRKNYFKTDTFTDNNTSFLSFSDTDTSFYF